MDSILQFFIQLGKTFKSLTPARKLSILVVGVITLISIVAFVFFVNQKEYKTLFSRLSTEDAGEIVAVLQEKKIPYKISSAGDSISIPAEHVSELRLTLASSGLPRGGGVGFEIFDKKSFGVTDFVQQLNYQRALQGELSRTISGLDEIQHSRVHIVIPQKSLFVEEQAKPTASVIIKQKAGRKLLASQIEGIASLVAGSVEGLSPEEVMIVDSGGNILSAARSGSELSRRTDSQIEFQRNIEKDLVNRIQSMLEKVVGQGKVTARVSAVLDFRVMEKTEESYDPEEPVIRSMHRRSEKLNEPNIGGRVAGSGGQSSADHEKTDETINYEINRVISKTVMPVGEVEKLSIAVLVDGVYNKNDKGVEEFQPRSEKEIQTMEDLVKGSIGFDAKRGDQIVVTSIPFRKMELETEGVNRGFWQSKLPLILPFIKYGVSLLVLILTLFFILRPLIRFVLAGGEIAGGMAGAGGGETKLPVVDKVTAALEEKPAPFDFSEFDFEDGTMDESLRGVDAVRNLATRDSRKFAELLRNWLK